MSPPSRSASTLPTWVRAARRPLVRATTSLGPRLLPQGDHIVFVSSHPNDPDALVILDFLAEHSQRRLLWLVPQLPERIALEDRTRHRVGIHRLSGAAALSGFLTSPLVFHTYGVYGVRRAHSRQAMVNVWHGDGPKRMRPHPMATTFMVTGVQAFGQRRMDVLQLPQDRLLVTGRPRVDDLHRGLNEPDRIEAQARLGLDGRPIIWWLPTWREHLEAPTELQADMRRYFTAHAFAQVSDTHQFVVKPHPNNPRQEWPTPWRVVTQSGVEQSGVRWYRLLGAASAILTDYSSVWSDFLNTDIPIAFIAPDADTYARERGFYMSNWRDFLPGPLLHDGADLGSFMHNLSDYPNRSGRESVARTLGSANTSGATSRLLSALSDRGIDWL